jgi:hypothetical protein
MARETPKSLFQARGVLVKGVVFTVLNINGWKF